MKVYNLGRYGLAYHISNTSSSCKLIAGNLLLALYDNNTRITTVNDIAVRLHAKVLCDFLSIKSIFDIPRRTDIIVKQLADSRTGFHPTKVYIR